MRSGILFATLLASTAALPARQVTNVVLWDNVNPEIKAEATIVKEDGNDQTQKGNSTEENSATESGSTSITTVTESQSNSDSESHSNSESSETSESPKATGTRVFANNTATISINPNLPAGSVVLTVPTSTANTYIKAGDYATFEWTFTNLIVSPTAVNVEAYCSANMQTYTIATNQSIDNSKAIWNTSDVLATADVGLMTAQYTLYIYDSNATATSISSAGFLTPLTYIFGVYLPQKYQPWAQSVNYINLGAIMTPPGIMTTIFSILSLLVIGLMA